MKVHLAAAVAAALLLPALPASAADKSETAKPAAAAEDKAKDEDRGAIFTPEASETTGSVTVGGRRIDYRAVAGTLVVHPRGWDDTDALEQRAKGDKDKADPKAEASIFYAAYFAKGAPQANRPITFLFNGGPGSATLGLHMGAFGPKRVMTVDAGRTPPAPYRLVDNAYSL